MSSNRRRSMMDWEQAEWDAYWDEQGRRHRERYAPKDIWGDTLCFPEDNETEEEREAALARHAQVLAECKVRL